MLYAPLGYEADASVSAVMCPVATLNPEVLTPAGCVSEALRSSVQVQQARSATAHSRYVYLHFVVCCSAGAVLTKRIGVGR